MEHIIKFNENLLEHHFSISDEFPVIVIKKIRIDSLYGQEPNAWSGKLFRLEPTLEIRFNRYYKMMNGHLRHPLYVDAFNFTHYHNPEFDIQKAFPDTEEFREEDRKGIYEGSIILNYKPQADVKPDISLLIEVSAGVSLRKNVSATLL